MANRIWGNETVMNYLKSGVFHHKPPITRAMHWEDPDGKPGCDFFGTLVDQPTSEGTAVPQSSQHTLRESLAQASITTPGGWCTGP